MLCYSYTFDNYTASGHLQFTIRTPNTLIKYTANFRVPWIYPYSTLSFSPYTLGHWSYSACEAGYLAAVCTPNTLNIRKVHWMWTAGFQCTCSVVQCIVSALIIISLRVSSVAVYGYTEPTLQPTAVYFQSALNIASSLRSVLHCSYPNTEPALHFDGGGAMSPHSLH